MTHGMIMMCVAGYVLAIPLAYYAFKIYLLRGYGAQHKTDIWLVFWRPSLLLSLFGPLMLVVVVFCFVVDCISGDLPFIPPDDPLESTEPKENR